MPPATPDNASAQVNGMQSSVNVGDDAHIVPPGWVHPRATLNGGMLNYPVPFNIQGGCVRLRVDVGIDPYIETVGACHSTYRSVPVRFGRLVAAPTGGAGGAFHSSYQVVA